MLAGVRSLRVGDRLHFLDRGEVSWALRAVRDDVEGTFLEVVSECYVHGVVDEEGFRSAPAFESKLWKGPDLRMNLLMVGHLIQTSLYHLEPR